MRQRNSKIQGYYHARRCHPNPAQDDHGDALTSCDLGLPDLFTLGTLQHDTLIHHMIESANKGCTSFGEKNTSSNDNSPSVSSILLIRGMLMLFPAATAMKGTNRPTRGGRVFTWWQANHHYMTHVEKKPPKNMQYRQHI